MKLSFLTYSLVLLIPILSISQEQTFLHQLKNSAKQLTQKQIDSFLTHHAQTTAKDTLAAIYHQIGLRWYYKKWNKDRKVSSIKNAISYTQKAIELKKNLAKIDTFSLAQSQYNICTFHKKQGIDIFKIINCYSSFIEDNAPNKFTEYAYSELGLAYSKLGDFHKAITSFKKANQHSLNNVKYIKNLIEIAETYSLMGYKEYSKNIKSHLQEADSLIHRHFKNDSNQRIEFIKLQINNIEANRLSEIGKHNEAITYHKKVLNALDSTNKQGIAKVYNSIAFSLTQLKNYKQAKEYLNKALKYDQAFPGSCENLGDIFLYKKDYKTALNYYQKAIALSTNKKELTDYKKPLTQDDLELAKEKLYLLNHLTTKANGLITFYKNDANKNHLKIALHTFLSADKLVDIIRFESTENQSKLFWREKSASLYMKAVEVCHLLNKPEDAYYFMERNKALLLLEDMTSEQAKTITQLPDSIAQREFELKQNIYLSENALHTLSSTHKDSLNHYKDLVFSTKQHYNTFVDSLELAFPDYAKMKRKTDILPYKTLKNNYCNNDYAVLQYILNDNQGYGLLSTNAKTLFFPLKHVNTLNNTLISFYKLLTKNETIPNRKEQLNQLSNTIFKTLIPKNIYNAINNKKLTIVPDYTLQQIPFETLCVNTNKQRYLIEDVDIHYAYSMSYLKSKEHIKSSAKKNWLGYAPINFETHQLPKLAFSKTEVTEANTLQNGKMVLSTNASKSKWLHQMPHYKINHLSTHADIDSTGNHWIAFSDEKLYINEIYATKNQSDMVVLSACNTSTGELKKGEGVMSLARGFFHSGAKSVVSSLWFADDKSSKDIIVDFYKELDKGQTKSAALRQAKLNYINAYRDTKISPSRWGALILIGDNSPIKHYVFSTTAIIAIVILVLIVIVFLLFKRKKGLKFF